MQSIRTRGLTVLTAAYIYKGKFSDPEQALVILSVPVILNAAKDLKITFTLKRDVST